MASGHADFIGRLALKLTVSFLSPSACVAAHLHHCGRMTAGELSRVDGESLCEYSFLLQDGAGLGGPSPHYNTGPPALQNEQSTLAYGFTGMPGLAAASSQYGK